MNFTSCLNFLMNILDILLWHHVSFRPIHSVILGVMVCNHKRKFFKDLFFKGISEILFWQFNFQLIRAWFHFSLSGNFPFLITNRSNLNYLNYYRIVFMNLYLLILTVFFFLNNWIFLWICWFHIWFSYNFVLYLT